MRPYQISGPGWLDSELYDITAKLPPDTKDEDFRLMLQRLLTERFRIESHRDTKELPQYRLVVAKGGLKLKAAQKLPAEQSADERLAAMEKLAAARAATSQSGSTRPQHSMGLRGTVAHLAGNLESPVVDKTGCEGLYSFNLEWSENGTSGPSLFTAVQDQLGLKVEAVKAPVENR